MKNLKMENLKTNKGNKAKNQYLIESDTIKMFKSYNSNIVKIDYKNNIITFGQDWDYSNTTSKYLNKFLSDFLLIAEKVNKKFIENIMELGKLDLKFNSFKVKYDSNL